MKASKFSDAQKAFISIAPVRAALRDGELGGLLRA